jgi:hypothetical protein
VEGKAMEKVVGLVLGVTVMVLSLRADRSRRARNVARVALGLLFLVLMAFHLGVLFFGWWLWLYAVPMLGALILQLRAERRVARMGLSRTDAGGSVPQIVAGMSMPGGRR